MNSGRWRQIDDCYHSALERPVPERAAFLAQICADDPDLRREVESLLAHEGRADELLENPAWNHVALSDETGTLASAALPVGLMMAEYRIAGKLGAGGMGEVYRTISRSSWIPLGCHTGRQSFLVPAIKSDPQPYTVVLNWQAGLKKR